MIEHYIQSGLIEQKEERLKPAKSKVYSAGGLRFAMLSVFCHIAVIAVFIFGSNFMTPHKVNEPVLVIEAVLISPLKSQPTTSIMNRTVSLVPFGVVRVSSCEKGGRVGLNSCHWNLARSADC